MKSPGPRQTAAIFAIIVIAGLFWLAPFIPADRLWGINHLRYLPDYPRAVLAAMFIAFSVLFAYSGRLAILRKLGELIDSIYRRRYFRLIISLISIFVVLMLFSIFRNETNILGDGLLRIAELKRPFRLSSNQPLDLLLHHLTFTFILEPLGFKYAVSYQVWSYIAGILFIWSAWPLARRFSDNRKEASYYFVYFICWGGSAMFFGYAENYALAAVLLINFFKSSVDYLRSGEALWKSCSWLLAAFLFHNLAAIFLPALFFLAFRRGEEAILKRLLPPVATVIPMIAWISYFAPVGGGSLMLFESLSEPGVYVWSGSHLLNVMNAILLISPSFFMTIWLAGISPDKTKNEIRWFFAIGAVMGFAVLLFLDPKLGLGRDWDLFAFSLLGFHMVPAAFADLKKLNRFIRTMIITIPAVSLVSWIMVNSGEAGSLQRYEDIISSDVERASYSYEVLGSYHFDLGHWEDAERAYIKSLAKSPRYRNYMYLGRAYLKMNRIHDAARIFQKAVDLDPNRKYAYFYLGEIHYNLRMWEQARLNYYDYIRFGGDRSDVAKRLAEAEAKINSGSKR